MHDAAAASASAPTAGADSPPRQTFGETPTDSTPSRKTAALWKRAEAKASEQKKQSPSDWVSFDRPTEQAIRFDYDASKQKWAETRTLVKLAEKPFAEGAMRECYKMASIPRSVLPPLPLHFVVCPAPVPRLTRMFFVLQLDTPPVPAHARPPPARLRVCQRRRRAPENALGGPSLILALVPLTLPSTLRRRTAQGDTGAEHFRRVPQRLEPQQLLRGQALQGAPGRRSFGARRMTPGR